MNQKMRSALFYYFFCFFRLSRLSPGSALFMVASSTVGIHPAAVNVDEVPSFTTIYGFIVVQTTRLVHKYNNEPCINIMIRKTKYNHPSNDRKTRNDLAQKTTEMSRMSMVFVKKLHAHGVSGLISG